MLTELSLCVVLLSVLYYYVIFYYFECGRIKKYVDKLPGPPVWPIIGSFPGFGITPEALWKIIHKWDELYYPIFRVWTTHRVAISILDPDDIKTVLTSTVHTVKLHIITCVLQPWLGKSSLNSDGEKCRIRRKILTPAFHRDNLQNYVDNIVENGEKIITDITKKGTFVDSDVTEFVTRYTLNVIREIVMGLPLKEKHDNSFEERYKTAIRDMGDIILFRIAKIWFLVNWTFRLTSYGRLQEKTLKFLHSFTRKVVDERKTFLEGTNGHFSQLSSSQGPTDDDKSEDSLGYRKKCPAMLDTLIAAQKEGGQIDDEGIREEVDTLIFKGHSFTSVALSFALLLIAEHKDVQERIRAEVNTVLEESEGEITMSELNRLDYTEMCIKESLRLYPGSPFIFRKLSRDLQLKNGLLPKESMMSFHVFSIHRNPRIWKEPENFDPERFSPKRFETQHPFSYIPFSAGSRNCIGKELAMLEMKALVALLVRNFHLEPIDFAHEVPLRPNYVTRPCGPMRVRFVRV